MTSDVDLGRLNEGAISNGRQVEWATNIHHNSRERALAKNQLAVLECARRMRQMALLLDFLLDVNIINSQAYHGYRAQHR